jgi:hypothetical protein
MDHPMVDVVIAIPIEKECAIYSEIEIEEHHHAGEDVQYLLSVRSGGPKFDITALLLRQAPSSIHPASEDQIQ